MALERHDTLGRSCVNRKTRERDGGSQGQREGAVVPVDQGSVRVSIFGVVDDEDPRPGQPWFPTQEIGEATPGKSTPGNDDVVFLRLVGHG